MGNIKVGQFGKIGENMVAFELSKRGWIVFLPPYDERVDIVAMKFKCVECGATWDITHKLHCTNSECKYFNEIPKKEITKAKKCKNCGKIFYRGKGKDKVKSQVSICPDCGTPTLDEIALCSNCKSEVTVKEENCTNPLCNSKNYKIIFRSIQVKSTHYVDNGKNLGFNFKYQDLLNDNRHFFIVYLREINECEEKHNYWVLSQNDFKEIKNINTVAFKIYQNDRGHYLPAKLEKFRYNEEMACKIQKKIEKETDPIRIAEYKKLLKKYDTFLKLEDDL